MSVGSMVRSRGRAPPAGAPAAARCYAPWRRPVETARGAGAAGWRSAEVGVELAVAVGEHQHSLDVGLRLLERQVLDEQVELGLAARRPRRFPHPADAV